MNCADLATDEGLAGIKMVNFGFFGVILWLRNDLTTVVGLVRITAGSVPLEKSPNHGY